MLAEDTSDANTYGWKKAIEDTNEKYDLTMNIRPDESMVTMIKNDMILRGIKMEVFSDCMMNFDKFKNPAQKEMRLVERPD